MVSALDHHDRAPSSSQSLRPAPTPPDDGALTWQIVDVGRGLDVPCYDPRHPRGGTVRFVRGGRAVVGAAKTPASAAKTP